jgi:acyl-CoA thioester hydrolase
MMILIPNYIFVCSSAMTNSHNSNNIKQHAQFDWLYPLQFTNEWKIQSSHIDHYQHTNNTAYLTHLEKLAWEHSAALGLSFADYQALDRAMVITKHELNYHLPSHLKDRLICATWIVSCDKRCRLKREFQYINAETGKTIFTASTYFVCVSLQTGAPKKMPDVFKRTYGQVAIQN